MARQVRLPNSHWRWQALPEPEDDRYEAEPSGQRDRFVEVDVLDQIEQSDPIGHRPLERLPARDKSSAAGSLIDYRRSNCIGEIVFTRGPTRINEANAPHVAPGDLVAHKVDRMVARETLVNEGARLTKIDRGVAPIAVSHLLLDDVGRNRRT